MIQTICGWCGKHLGWKDGQGVQGISHGICNNCAKTMRSDYNKGANNE